MGTVQNDPVSSNSKDLQDIEGKSFQDITEELDEWTRRIECASNLLQLYHVDYTQQKWEEWKEEAVDCIGNLFILLDNRKALVDNWFEQSTAKTLSKADCANQGVDCSTEEEMERELINAKLQLAQVEEENAKLEFAYSRLLREGNEVAESTSVSESFMERLQVAKQGAEDADIERQKLNEEIERLQSQLFLCRRRNQHLLEEYRALEGDWN